MNTPILLKGMAVFFNIVVTCEPDGKEAVARFYQLRPEEVTWLNEENDLENYKHEAILLLKVH